jgi:hypothetical protein
MSDKFNRMGNFLEALAYSATDERRDVFIGGSTIPYYLVGMSINGGFGILCFDKSSFARSGHYYELESIYCDEENRIEYIKPPYAAHVTGISPEGDDHGFYTIINLKGLPNIKQKLAMINTKSAALNYPKNPYTGSSFFVEACLGEGIVYNKDMKSLVPSVHDDMHFDHAIKMVQNYVARPRMMESYMKDYLRNLCDVVLSDNLEVIKKERNCNADYFDTQLQKLKYSIRHNIRTYGQR